jgi:NAD+ kinase
MRRIGFVLHPAHAAASELFATAGTLADEIGLEVRRLNGSPEPVVADGIVSLGGDGTMLRALAFAYASDVPALGVNLGQLGFLAEVEPEELATALRALAADAFQLEERCVVKGTVRARGSTRELVGFKEFVIERESSGHVIRGELRLGGRPFLRYQADGLIVATPTGSTAYNLSARGPIVSPHLRALVVTPLSPHMLFDRALVLDEGTDIEFTVGDGPRASIMVDGRVEATLGAGDSLRLALCARPVRLVRLVDLAFYEIVRRKFHLGPASQADDA